MRIFVKSRMNVRDFDPGLPFVVISMCATCYDFAEIDEANRNLVGVLRLRFDDIDDPIEAEMFDLVAFTPEDARKVLSFVKIHEGEVGAIVCQCDAGVSRSSGTAAALSRIYNGDDSWVFNSPDYCPNRLVYRTILDEYHSKRKGD